MRPDWSWKVAAIVVVVCGLVEAYTLLDRSRSEPRNHDIRQYVLGEIYDEHRVEQQLLVQADGLSSITVHPRPASPSPSGTVRLQVWDLGSGRDRTLVHDESMPLATMARMESVRVRFAPQRSRYRNYALLITVAGASDGQGIGLLAARGDGYRGATLLINDRRMFGDLVFETTVDQATTNFGAIAAQIARGGIPAPALMLMLVVALKYAVLVVVIRAFTPGASASAPRVQAPPPLTAPR